MPDAAAPLGIFRSPFSGQHNATTKKQEADPANPTSCSILLFQMLLSKTDKKKRVMRIELTCSAWKADVLPLNYTRKKVSEPGGIRTPDPRLRRPLLYPAELLIHTDSARDIMPQNTVLVNTFFTKILLFSVFSKVPHGAISRSPSLFSSFQTIAERQATCDGTAHHSSHSHSGRLSAPSTPQQIRTGFSRFKSEYGQTFLWDETPSQPPPFCRFL